MARDDRLTRRRICINRGETHTGRSHSLNRQKGAPVTVHFLCPPYIKLDGITGPRAIEFRGACTRTDIEAGISAAVSLQVGGDDA